MKVDNIKVWDCYIVIGNFNRGNSRDYFVNNVDESMV